MTNEEKLREIFPKTIFIYRKKDDKTTAIMCSDEWLSAEYKEPTAKNDLSSGLEKNSKKLEKDFGELDCISRADAIKAMQDKAKKLTNEDTINGLCGAVAILFDMPPVTPQKPKTGHWIRVDKDKLKCSKCDVIHFIAQYPQGKIVWCPNCGAIMESEE